MTALCGMQASGCIGNGCDSRLEGWLVCVVGELGGRIALLEGMHWIGHCRRFVTDEANATAGVCLRAWRQ